jgi:hypothetical protein
MTKHTPGPWTVLHCPIHPPEHAAWNICAHLADKNGVKIPKTVSNMQLQSAAPDLLKSADALLRFIDEHQFHQSGDDVIFPWPPLRDLIEKMRTASAKAKGKP